MLHEVASGAPLPSRDAIAKRVRAGLPATIDMTVAEYLRQWLASRRKIERSTALGYESHFRVHLVPHLGAIPLVKLRVDDVDLPSGARPKGRLWTDNAVRRWRETGEQPSPVVVWMPEQAGQFLDYAEDHGIVLYPLFAPHSPLWTAPWRGRRTPRHKPT